TETVSAADVLGVTQRHRVTVMTFVGDAFGWPLVEELERGDYDISSLRVAVSGGAALHANCKRGLLARVPGLRVVENIGSSESGILGSQHSDAAAAPGDTTFIPDESTVIIAEDFSRILTPGHDGIGWLARRGRIPLGYLGDAEKTARTFPVVDGVRLSVPGDRARLLRGGRVEMLGRDSMTINTGGEKVFVEEVEEVLRAHPAIADALVVGRPSERWGEELVALVELRDGADATPEALQAQCTSQLARFKAPKEFIFVDHVHRLGNGKADYRWAKNQASKEATAKAPMST
ncbi:AMP-binding enzyme, partial [Mycobacterium sp.]|uniref:AMP-binding enzyme n=1 Tax=Mycobacterium sp. TaxID=1785 RepID=UPI003F9D7C02